MTELIKNRQLNFVKTDRELEYTSMVFQLLLNYGLTKGPMNPHCEEVDLSLDFTGMGGDLQEFFDIDIDIEYMNTVVHELAQEPEYAGRQVCYVKMSPSVDSILFKIGLMG